MTAYYIDRASVCRRESRGTSGGADRRLGNSDSGRFHGQQAIAKQRRGRQPENTSVWDDVVWLPCRDGKLRPTQPGISPLVNGIASDLVRDSDPCIQTEATAEARGMRIKGYGNAIVAPLAIAFVEAVMEAMEE